MKFFCACSEKGKTVKKLIVQPRVAQETLERSFYRYIYSHSKRSTDMEKEAADVLARAVVFFRTCGNNYAHGEKYYS